MMYIVKDINGGILAGCSDWRDAVGMTNDDDADQIHIFEDGITWIYDGWNNWINNLTLAKRASTWKDPANET